MKGYRFLTVIAAGLVVASSLVSCNNTNDISENKTEDIENSTSSNNASDNIEIVENTKNEEESVINENYADSELYVFTGTIDEMYEDGSMLLYSPEFGVNFNYRVIVEFDENSVIDGFVPAVNQHVKFEVYSVPKKINPLTVVAVKLTLLNEVSTQREEEEARIAELEKRIAEIEANFNLSGNNNGASSDNK